MAADTIKFLCPKCKKKIRVPGQYGGKRGGCPACKEFIDIPASSTLPDGDLPVLEGKEAAATGSSSKRAAVPVPTEIPTAVPVPADEPEPVTVVSDVQEQESFIKKDAPAEAPKSAFIKFACPGCGKMTGFPANMAGTPASCPTCKVKLMVPEKNGEDSFILGGVPTGPKAAQPKPAAPKPRPRFDPDAAPAPMPAEAPAPGGFPVKIVAIAAVVLVAVLVGVLIGMRGKGGDEKQAAQNTTPNPAPAQSPSVAPATQPAKTEAHAPAQEPAQPKQPAPEINPSPVVAPEPAKTEAHAKTEEATGPFANTGKTLDEPKTQAAPETVETKTTAPAKTGTGSSEEEDIDVNKKPKTDVAMPAQGEKTGAPADPAKIEPPKPAPPAVVCSDCLGTGFTPILPPRPYVRLGSDPIPNPAVPAPWTWCPKCQKAHKNDELLKAETDRLAASLNRNKDWCQKTGLQLLYVETKNISLHANLPPAMAKKTGDALDRLVAHLQSVTHSTLFTQARPEDHQILIAFDNLAYNKIIDMFEKDNPGDDWKLARQSSGSFGRHLGFFNARTGNPTPPDHMAIYQFANMLMQEATDGKAPAWLTAGFSAYCEKTITNLNLCYSFSYEKNDVQFGQDWDVDLKKFATQGKLKTWEYIFPLSGVGMSSLDYLTCYSMVSYFMKSDPRLFQQVILNIKDGMESGKAVEKVYKRPVRDLQMMWAQWAMR